MIDVPSRVRPASGGPIDQAGEGGQVGAPARRVTHEEVDPSLQRPLAAGSTARARRPGPSGWSAPRRAGAAGTPGCVHANGLQMMRTKTGPVPRPPRRLKVASVRGRGEVVQVLHPLGADLDAADAARLLRQVSQCCHAENKLLLTGAGFVTLLLEGSAWSRAQLREEAGL